VRLPHEFPFRLVDRPQAGVARVAVSANEFWDRGLAARGAGLWLEAMAQSAALTLEGAGAGAGRMALAGVERFLVHRSPAAGELVHISARLEAGFGPVVRVAAIAEDSEGTVAEGVLLLVGG